jgi:alpha-tubulin suppressor-like RCC1 family protein/phosphodiesterase/alkaline phosphatase D-like protein
MIFRKKTQNMQQKSVPKRRMDGIVTYSVIKKSKPLGNENQKLVGHAKEHVFFGFLKKVKETKKTTDVHVSSLSNNAKEKESSRSMIGTKKVFHKLKKLFVVNSVFTKRAFASLMILMIVGVAFFQDLHNAQSATFTWTQKNWKDGANPASLNIHPGKVDGFFNYSSADAFVQVKNAGEDVELNKIAGSSIQTSDTGGQDTHNGGGFNAGTKNQTKVREGGVNAKVGLAFEGISSVASGNGHTLLIKSDNTVWAWGENANGQLGEGTSITRMTPIQVLDATGSGHLANIENVAAGNTHSLALDIDGTVWAWGANDRGQLGDGTNNGHILPAKVKDAAGTANLSGIVAIAAGDGYSLALSLDGKIYAWGANNRGQLGIGAIGNQNLPNQVSALSSASMISSGSGGATSVAALSDGTVWAWGAGTSGQLGNGFDLDSNVPVQVTGLTNVTTVNAGQERALARKSDGTVWAWGNNSSGELGNGNNTSSNIPVQVSSLTGIVSINGGNSHALAIKSDGSVWAWGNNNKGQLGDGSSTSRSTPVQVSGLTSGIVMVAGGLSYSAALKSDGTVWTWGWGTNGRLGNNNLTDTYTPVQVWGQAQGTLSGFSIIESGYSHTLALKNDGTVWAWGSNSSGQLGDNTNISRLTPVQVVGLTGIIDLAAGKEHSMALKNDGTVWAWGSNFYGQLGNNTTSSQNTPVQVKDPSDLVDGFLHNITEISVGEIHSMAIKNDISGTSVWAWGGNTRGQLGDYSLFNRKVPVQVKDQSGTGFLTNILSISAGGFHSLASLSNGTAWAWGANDQGQLGNYDLSKNDTKLPVQVTDAGHSGILNVAKVSGGYAYSMALRTDGSAMSWGENTYGQLGTGNRNPYPYANAIPGAGSSNVTQIKAGNNHSMMLKNDISGSSVWAWGSNSSGQLGTGDTSDSNSPFKVKDSAGTGNISNISHISSGGATSAALSADGNTIWNWGSNQNGELGQNTTANKFLPVAVWGPASGTINAGHTYYYSSGTFTSAVINTGGYKTFTTINYNTTIPAGTNITSVTIKAGNTAIVDGSWVTMNNVANGDIISALGNKKYYQYIVTMTGDTTVTPTFNDITFNYDSIPSPGHLISSPYDTSDMTNVLSQITWNETITPGSTAVHFQVRTAPDQAGNPGTWTAWMGPGGLAAGGYDANNNATFFSDKLGQAMPSEVTNGTSDQWIQYQAFLISDGLATPTLHDVTMQYVVNAPPEVQNVSASQGSDGKVTVNYEVRDPDTAYIDPKTGLSPNKLPGQVVISLQYCTANCASLTGGEIWTDAVTVNDGLVDHKASVKEGPWSAYQLTWNPKSDYPNMYAGGDFKVRVRANDTEGANNFGYGQAPGFIFDTSNPTNVRFAIDSTTKKLHLTVPNDDSSLQMMVSNSASFFGASYENISPDYTNPNIGYSYPSMLNDPATVYMRIKDAYGNYTDAGSIIKPGETTPIKLSDMVFYDISNKATGEYRELISWKAPIAGEFGSGGFKQYNIWRSDDNGVTFNLKKVITDPNVNYYLDSGLTSGAIYSYKVNLEDKNIVNLNGNTSDYSTTVTDVADGEGGASSTAPTISGVTVSAISDNSATVTWNTLDVNSNSTVGYSTTAGDYSNEIGNATLMKSGHSIVLTGLQRNKTYYFRVKSTSVGNGVSMDNGYDAVLRPDGYTFTTTNTADITPPTISVDPAHPLPVTTSKSASIFWLTTNQFSAPELATSFVEYSKTNGFSTGTGTTYGSYDMVSTHAVTLPNILDASTVYYYKIHSRDAAGNEQVSGQASFTTDALPDTTKPVIDITPSDSIQVSLVTHKTATINWTTLNKLSNSFVEYGLDTSYGKTIVDNTYTFNHVVGLPLDLLPNTQYHYRVKSVDSLGNDSGYSADHAFMTLPDPADVTPPVVTIDPGNATAISATSATIKWKTNERASSHVGYSTIPGNFTIEQGSSTYIDPPAFNTVTLEGLTPNTTYYYQVKSIDTSGLIGTANVDSGGTTLSFTTASGTAPTITVAPSVDSITTTSATVHWTTNDPSTSFVEYSTAADFSITPSVFGKYDSVQVHTIVLQNLAPNTNYYYRVRSAASFEVQSGIIGPFTTQAMQALPVISGVIKSASYNTANISWITSVAADSYVEYWTGAQTHKTFGDSSKVLTRTISLPQDLAENTTYNFILHSTNSTGGEGTYADTFTTGTATLPTITMGTVVKSYNTATINWTTDVNSNSFVEYWKGTDMHITIGTDVLVGGTAPFVHSVSLPQDLAANTDYNYQVYSTNALGKKNAPHVPDYLFKTDPSPTAALPVISNITSSTTENSATITWDTNVQADSFVEYWVGAGEHKTVGTTVLVMTQGSNSLYPHSVTLPQDLSPNTQYNFKVRSRDVEGTEGTSSGSDFFKTKIGLDIVRPDITDISVTGVTDNKAYINWSTNNKDTDSVVYVGTSTNYSMVFGDTTVSQKTHSVEVTGLTAGTLYNYQIISKDKVTPDANVRYSANDTFVTLATAGAPVLTNIKDTLQADAKIASTYNQVSITWTSDVAGSSMVSFYESDTATTPVRIINYPLESVTSHSIVVDGLPFDTKYYYTVTTIKSGSVATTTSTPRKSFTTVKPDPLNKDGISNVVTTPNANSASVTFNTNQAAKCIIEYRPDGQNYSTGSSAESDFNLNHRIQLLSLVSSNTYFFKISCTDNLGNAPIFPAEYSFITTQSDGSSTDKIPPTISSVGTGTITGESVIITWNTNKKASSYVRFGTTSTLGSMVGDDLINFDQTKYATSHTVTINSLVPATNYSFSVLSVDASGNIAEGGVQSFTTATQSSLNSISIISKVLGEATITWTTINNANSTVEYGLTNSYGSKSESTSQTKLHEVNLRGLTIGQLYHFRVKSADSLGNTFVSGDYAFQPKSPPVITSVAVKDVTENGATITFSTNVPTDAVAGYTATNDKKNSGSQGQTDLATAHVIILKNLTPGTTFTLKVQAKDEGGNSSELVGPNFTTGKDESAPEIDQVHTDSALAQNDKVQSIISWVTNENATTSIVYREGKNGEPMEIAVSDAYTKNHLAVVTAFKSGTVYNFNVKSVDASGNEGISNDFAMLTPKKKENIIQIIVNNFQDIFHWASR